MTTILIILCICNILQLSAFIYLTFLKLRKGAVTPVTAPYPMPPSSEPTKPKVDPIDEERAKQRIKAETEAFQELMNYSADVAYGITPTEE